jgi:anthranilate synthase component 1
MWQVFFLGKDPFLILRARGGRTTIERGGSLTESERPFLETLRGLMADFRSPFVPDLPRFTGGAVGYLGYGAASWFEPVLGDLGEGADGADPAGFMLFETVLAFDHAQHRILIISNARITGDDDLESLYHFACAKIQFLERELERNLSVARREASPALDVRSNHTREQFEAQVRAAKEYIAAGEIYQVVLSQRFEADVAADPFTVYRALRHVNPSPYMYFLRMGGVSLVGSSPEMLVRVEGSHVETRSRGPGRAGAARRRTFAWPRSSSATRKSVPSTSCSSIWAGTMSVASATTARCASRSSWAWSASPMSCT